jgi:hypothetical protein
MDLNNFNNITYSISENDNYYYQNEMNEMTYDDILNTLNVRIQNGKLEALKKYEQPNKKKVTFNENIKQKKEQPLPIEPNIYIQNSYIYNKYFKNYSQQNNSEELEMERIQQMTPEEYKKYIRDKAIEAYKQRIRINQIKSKKLLFNNGNNDNIQISTNPNNTNNLNKMFKFVGKR